jgi:lipopolysaccharide export system protein LptC
VLGALALVLLLGLVLWPVLTKDRSGLRISFTDKGSAGAPAQPTDSPVMNTPEYRGITNKGEQFVINGTKATQITPTLMRVEKMTSHLIRLDNAWDAVSSDWADYHQDTKIIELFGNVTATNDKGYVFVTSHATVDTNTSDVHGDQPVTGTGPMGNILASRFEIMDSGAHIVFMGGAQQVHVHIDRNKKPA